MGAGGAVEGNWCLPRFEPEIATGQQSIRKERHVDKSKYHLKSVRMNGHRYPLLTNSSFGAVGILHDTRVPFAMVVSCFERALREACRDIWWELEEQWVGVVPCMSVALYMIFHNVQSMHWPAGAEKTITAALLLPSKCYAKYLLWHILAYRGKGMLGNVL